jgi:hypothetical protein
VNHELPKVGRRYCYRAPHNNCCIEFWAEEGMVYLEDQNTGEFHSLTQAEAKEYFQNIGIVYTKVDIFSVDDSYFKDMKPEYRNLLLDMQSVIHDAKEQGDPTEAYAIQRKEAAVTRSQLAAYAQPLAVHNNGMKLGEPHLDPRAKRLKNGALYLPRGGGQRTERKHY